jgi:hypothetical protein
MRLELGRRLVSATIKPKPSTGSLGHVRKRKTKLDVDWFDDHDWRLRRWAQTEIMCALAGPEAERRFTGRRNRAGAVGDEEWVTEVALWAEGWGDARRLAYIGWLRLVVREEVAWSLFWDQVEGVADALLDRETLSGKEVRAAALDGARRALDAALGRDAGHEWEIRPPGTQTAAEDVDGIVATGQDGSPMVPSPAKAERAKGGGCR